MPEVRCSRVSARCVRDDATPSPLMEDVSIKPVTGTPFLFDVFPDTGCYQSLMSLDLVSAYGMHLDRGPIKKIKAVDGGQMECCGSVSFQASYEGRTTDVLALVTPALQDEILLSWRNLQGLGVIPEDFPHRACTTKAMPEVKIEPKESSPKRPDQTDSTKERVPKRPEFEPETTPTQSLLSGPKGHPWIGMETLIKEEASVFNNEEKLRTMKSGPLKIRLKDGPIKPIHVNTPRKTPYAFQSAAKSKLN